MGAKHVITTGAKTRAFDDEMVISPLLGDPASRSIMLPNYHITQAPNAGKTTFDADDVQPTSDAAYGKAGEDLSALKKPALSEISFRPYP